MDDCIFCKIIDGSIPSYKVYEDDRVLAFLDIKPLTKGHTVVIPKKHAETMIDLPDGETGYLFLVVKRIVTHLKRVLMPDGFNVAINMKKAAGQVVDHLHVHILPRWADDGGGSVHSIVKNPPKESLTDILEQVKI